MPRQRLSFSCGLGTGFAGWITGPYKVKQLNLKSGQKKILPSR